MKKSNSIVKNAIFKFSLEILRIFIPIISVPYIYRIFNPEIMGQIEFSQSIVGYFFIFAGFGVYTYGLREISRVRDNKEQRDKLFTELFTISTVSSILVTFIYLGYVYFKFNFDNLLKNMLLINSINLISYVFYIEWINEAFENYKFISQKTMIVKLLNLACIFLFIKVSDDYFKYLFLINVFTLINNLASFIYIRRYINFSFNNLEIKKYLFPLGILILVSNINVLYTQLDKIVLGFYGKNIEEVAYYGVAQKVMSVLMVIVMSIINVTMPRLSYYLGQNQKDEYENLFNRIFPYIYLLLFPMGIGIIILSKEICIFFGGKAYLPAQAVVIVFGIRMIIVTVESLLSNHVIFLNQKEKVMAVILGICGVFNLLLKIGLIYFDIFTASTAIFTTMLAEILIITLDYWYIKKYLKLKLEIFKLKNLKYLLISLIFFPIKYFFSDLNFNIMINSILIFIMCSSAYFILLLLIKDRCLFELLEKIDIKKYIFRRK
ncbi:oligosaccharide flippase family protein [Fusobacterium sp.]|uniref:oligosaccharide flippase family protein n=1 Tax=Fusobacterium sp. TaxID=68766 RepID=UPI0025BC70F0|nr:oligosaccharide flippase family protein [Fusobacterium sp.]